MFSWDEAKEKILMYAFANRLINQHKGQLIVRWIVQEKQHKLYSVAKCHIQFFLHYDLLRNNKINAMWISTLTIYRLKGHNQSHLQLWLILYVALGLAPLRLHINAVCQVQRKSEVKRAIHSVLHTFIFLRLWDPIAHLLWLMFKMTSYLEVLLLMRWGTFQKRYF